MMNDPARRRRRQNDGRRLVVVGHDRPVSEGLRAGHLSCRRASCPPANQLERVEFFDDRLRSRRPGERDGTGRAACRRTEGVGRLDVAGVPARSRDGHADFVRIDEEAVARLEGVATSRHESVARRVDRDAVGARVLDVEDAVEEGDDGVAARDLRVRKDPVAALRAADDATRRRERVAARRRVRAALEAP